MYLDHVYMYARHKYNSVQPSAILLELMVGKYQVPQASRESLNFGYLIILPVHAGWLSTLL